MINKTTLVVLVSVIIVIILFYFYNKRNNQKLTTAEWITLFIPLITGAAALYQMYTYRKRDMQDSIQYYQKSAASLRDPILEYIIQNKGKLKQLFYELFRREAEATGIIEDKNFDNDSLLSDEEILVGHKIVKSCDGFLTVMADNDIKQGWLYSIIIWMRSPRLRKIWHVIDYQYPPKLRKFIRLCIVESSKLSKIPTKKELRKAIDTVLDEWE